MDVRISFSGTPDEMMEIYAKWLKRAIHEMKTSLTLDEAIIVWQRYPAFQDNINFIDPKEVAKKRLK